MPNVSNTLKQKLSNLALSQSASASASAPSSPSSFRNAFNFARNKLNPNSEPIYGQTPPVAIDDESLDEIMQRVIRQAGVDYEYAHNSFIFQTVYWLMCSPL